MSAELNHTIVFCRDQRRAAGFVARLLGRPEPRRFGPFLAVDLDNGVSLDFDEVDEPIRWQHYAFLVGDAEFDRGLALLRESGIEHYADPGLERPGEINHADGGRGLYFRDADGHLLELMTRPYGAGR